MKLGIHVGEDCSDKDSFSFSFLSFDISICCVADLHSIGGLVPLLNYLKNPNAGIRARAAEVVSTIVQNNPRSQQQVIECNGLENLLVNFNFDDDIKVRTKALGAISCTILY